MLKWKILWGIRLVKHWKFFVVYNFFSKQGSSNSWIFWKWAIFCFSVKTFLRINVLILTPSRRKSELKFPALTTPSSFQVFARSPRPKSRHVLDLKVLCITGKQPWSGIVKQHSDFSVGSLRQSRSAWFVKGLKNLPCTSSLHFRLKRRVS